MRYWGFEVTGKVTRTSVAAGLVLLAAILLEFYALFRALQPEDEQASDLTSDDACDIGFKLAFGRSAPAEASEMNEPWRSLVDAEELVRTPSPTIAGVWRSDVGGE